MVESQTKSESGIADPTSLEFISDTEIRITRRFQAPSRIVFEAWTKPELVQRWWAPKSHGVEMVSCEADVREGGDYRYVLRHPAAGELAFSGTYHEVSPYTRLVYTHCFEPMRDAGDAMVTVTFHEDNGSTLLESRERYPSKEALDGAVAAGMESGMRETMNQLDAMLADMG